jgi:RNA polymerase sigma-70 factor (ECF subfamily)
MDENEKLSDEQLIEKVRSIDQELFTLVLKRYQSKLLRYATGLVRDEDKASDIVQDSMIKAFVNLRSFNINKSFSSWIYRIVHNEAINVIKKYQKEVRFPENIDFKSDENIEEEFDKKEIVKKVQQCLKGIPLIYVEPITLFYIEEKSYEEISDILRLPMGTVATRINRAKKILRKICQKN